MRTNYGVGQSIVKITEYSRQSSIDDYSCFFDWLQSNLEKDYESVIQKRLVFLKEMYDKLVLELNHELNVEVCIDRLILIDTCEENRKKLKKYMDNTKEIYEYINSSEVQENYYRHYDNLGSWYSAQIDSTNRVLNKLSSTLSNSNS